MTFLSLDAAVAAFLSISLVLYGLHGLSGMAASVSWQARLDAASAYAHAVAARSMAACRDEGGAVACDDRFSFAPDFDDAFAGSSVEGRTVSVLDLGAPAESSGVCVRRLGVQQGRERVLEVCVQP